jgi:hypothetical protein
MVYWSKVTEPRVKEETQTRPFDRRSSKELQGHVLSPISFSSSSSFFFFFFLAVLGFVLRASWLSRQVLYHLSHSVNPQGHVLRPP